MRRKASTAAGVSAGGTRMAEEVTPEVISAGMAAASIIAEALESYTLGRSRRLAHS
jgi:hypothetical protein